MAIVIKKRVSLDFLGEDYKDAYLTFKSIPVVDFEEIQKDLQKFEKNQEGAIGEILDLLKKYFVEGKFPDNGELSDVVAEDLDGLDPQTCVECFKVFTGQELDPKAESPLTAQSVDSPPTSE